MPLWVKVFVTALAIADDLGAVVVIAVFYTGKLALYPSLVAAGLTLVLLLLNRLGVRRLTIYLGVGVLLWLAMGRPDGMEKSVLRRFGFQES